MQIEFKQFLSIKELIDNIKNNGINIKNENKVKEYLKYNNYYFITGYKDLYKTKKEKYKENCKCQHQNLKKC